MTKDEKSKPVFNSTVVLLMLVSVDEVQKKRSFEKEQ